MHLIEVYLVIQHLLNLSRYSPCFQGIHSSMGKTEKSMESKSSEGVPELYILWLQ